MKDEKNILVLALGNDLLGDDAIGLMVARALQNENENNIDIIESPVAGFALLDYLEGYDKVLLLDAMSTGAYPEGTIVELTPHNFQECIASSPHYVGLPEIFALAHRLDISFPNEVKILAMEISHPYELRESLSENIFQQMPPFISKAKQLLAYWQ
jgi:hydrogenase maturation protease